MPRRVTQVKNLFFYIFMALSLMGAVEYFKYGTRTNYEWFHCRPQKELIGGPGSTVYKLWSRGGPSCDKRGEFKTLVKRISRDYEPNEQHLSFCIIENKDVGPIHYPIHEDKGEPGYIAYAGYNQDSELVKELCGDNVIYNM